jgi:two-component system chemotaxis response regulator CheY
MKTILIVDDNPELLDCLQHMLIHFGHRAIPARDAEVALAVIHGGASVDLVITDYHMPGMHGLELAGRLKRTAPAVPVIMCSAFAGQDICRDALAIGVAAIVEKPYSLQALRQVVDDVLGQAPAKQALNS